MSNVERFRSKRSGSIEPCWRFTSPEFLFAILLMTSACSSSELSLSGPSAAKCRVSVANSMEMAPSGGGSGSLTITTTRDCTWAASSAAAWVVITSASNGQGDGSIGYRVAANTDPAGRSTTIDINDSKATIAQAAAECRFTVSPRTPSVGAGGGTIAIQVQSSANCAWTATTSASWIHITAGASGNGNGTVTASVDRNTGAPRNAPILVAGDTLMITQGDSATPAPSPSPTPAPSPTCSYSIQPTGQTIASGGGNGTIAVTAGATCDWTAVSDVGWIRITGGASGTGAGSVAFNVSLNRGASRTGAISVAGQTFTITQAGATCSYEIKPSTQALTAGGGTVTVTVITDSACGWMAASNDSWIAISSGGSGTGGGTVRLTVAPNTGAERRGTASIALQTFTVTQAAAPCSYTLSPSSVDVPPSGGNRSTTVTAGAGCSWTATTNDAWITITDGTSGNGNGSIRFQVAANGGVARSGKITIGTQTLTVTQNAEPCTFGIAPPSQAVPAAGGSGSVTVTTSGSCGWAATSNNPDWLSITSGGSATGAGTVTFTALPNNGSGTRTGTLTIAGQNVSVSQEAVPPPCTFSISPMSQQSPAAGGPGAVSVTTGVACTWNAATPNGDWLKITAGSGTGSGTVNFTTDPNNTGALRSGTLTIMGQTASVTQDPVLVPCAFSLSATSQPVPAGGGSSSVSVNTSGGCAWTAASNNPDWLSISSGQSGNGAGAVSFAASANATGAPRTGTLSIAGQTFIVTQDAAPCAFTISSTGQAVPSGGGSGSVSVNTASGCAWTAMSNNPDWLAITSAQSGNGAGTVSFTASPNGTGAPRTGTLSIAGQTFTVTQDPAPCTFSISSTSQTVPASGGSGQVSINGSGGGCAWTATSNNPDWLVITDGSSGKGGGNVSFTANANGTGAPRTGTLTIAGQFFTVTQSGP